MERISDSHIDKLELADSIMKPTGTWLVHAQESAKRVKVGHQCRYKPGQQ